MSHLYASLSRLPQYWDKLSGIKREEWLEAAKRSHSVYVGNIAFHTSEDQLYELFRKAGEVDSISMGLNKQKKVPCGFCFVTFVEHEGAVNAVELLNESVCDERIIRVDWDAGLDMGGDRRFGRGLGGVQWRDVFRKGYDAGRGGEGQGLEPSEVGRSKRRRSEPAPRYYETKPQENSSDVNANRQSYRRDRRESHGGQDRSKRSR
eukprot:Selendium_serpulae@DN1801_c0_g1_i1.p1